jgi:hypothetical protein
MKLQGRIIEGLSMDTSSLDAAKNSVSSTSTSSSTSSSTTSNLGSGAADYASKINKAVSLFKDQMNISQYRSDYENTIIQLDDLIGLNTLKTIMSIDPSNDSSLADTITKLSTYGQARSSLDLLMKFLDGLT